MTTSNKITYLLVFLSVLMAASCATYKSQLIETTGLADKSDKKPVHTFFIAGGFGNSDKLTKSSALLPLRSALEEASAQTTLLFSGDNISTDEDNWERDKILIDQQVAIIENFKGNTIFIPGNNEWKSYSTKKIERVEEYLDKLDKDRLKFYPKNVCPITHEVINEELDMIIIDSKWWIANWSRIKDINKKCTNIVTRRRFMEELEGYINDSQGKNLVIVMHHPIFSNGIYGGQETLKSHLSPLPILGTLRNGIMGLGGFSPERLNSIRYNYLRIAVSSLASASERVTLVSGHEQSLQYLKGGNIHQIISGSLTEKSATKRSKSSINTIGGSLPYEGIFTHGASGFAKLDYFEDGSSQVTFVTNQGEKSRFEVLPEMKKIPVDSIFAEIEDKTKQDVIITDKDALDKSGFYKFLWGERYRKYFGTSITARVAMLDTLYGGLEFVKEGGGHQSYSIRLKNKEGKEYSMRSLRKNALKFLRFKIPGVAYTEDDYDDTMTEDVISDFFTTAHPYMQLVINPMARAIQVNHSSPELFYVPKQKALGALNTEFGDELYFIEERPSDEQMNFKGYRRAINESGQIEEFESTTDMFEKLKSDEKYTVDQRAFIRARLFDMLLGDWDRHQDQWRWVEYEKDDGDVEFLPVPRDRDNAFPKFDGFAMNIVKLFVPNTRNWQTYDSEIDNIKWLNNSGNKIDRTILTRFDTEVWEEEANYILTHLRDEVIDRAFLKLPREVQDSDADQIRENLKRRLAKLPEYAKEYCTYLNKIVVLHGTEKDDKISVTRLAGGKTKVVLRRIFSDDANEKMYERTFDKKDTKEIWIYGLGDKDVFEVDGEDSKGIKVRLIGGYGEDTFDIANKKKIRAYDWVHEETVFSNKTPIHQLTDVYRTNTFHWRYFERNANLLVPTIGFRSDDGLYLGARDTYFYNGFNGKKFKQKHSLNANYYFKFKAVEVNYSGVFANVIPKWNLEVNGYFTNNRFSNNFFGIGNESQNLEDRLGRDFYRTRMQKIKLNAGIAYHTLRFKALYESFKVREIPDRFFIPANLPQEVFGAQNYAGLETSALYDNADAKDFPSKSIVIGLAAGYKANTSIKENKFGYLKFKLGFSHKLIESGNLVLSTLARVHTNLGNDYFFYHAPSIGGDNGLRGFRDERFSGKTSFYQTSDLRVRLKRIVTAVAPITIGCYGGFDYGRVWSPEDSSDKWHTSQGIGFWASGLNFLSVNLGYFNSVEGNLVQFGFGFQF